jgi:hypothetical protein
MSNNLQVECEYLWDDGRKLMPQTSQKQLPSHKLLGTGARPPQGQHMIEPPAVVVNHLAQLLPSKQFTDPLFWPLTNILLCHCEVSL